MPQTVFDGEYQLIIHDGFVFGGFVDGLVGRRRLIEALAANPDTLLSVTRAGQDRKKGQLNTVQVPGKNLLSRHGDLRPLADVYAEGKTEGPTTEHANLPANLPQTPSAAGRFELGITGSDHKFSYIFESDRTFSVKDGEYLLRLDGVRAKSMNLDGFQKAIADRPEDLFRITESAGTQSAMTVRVMGKDLLTAAGTLRPLAEVFAEAEAATAKWAVFLEGNDGRRYTATFPGRPSDPSPEGLRRFVMSFAADRRSICKISRKGDKSRNEAIKTASVHCHTFFGPDGNLRPPNEVFEEACPAARPKTVFQPPGLPWCLCLQLEEPPNSEAKDWFLRFRLQAVDDPSLLVDLNEARYFTTVGGHLQYVRAELNEKGRFDVKAYGKVLRQAALRLPILQLWLVSGKWLDKGMPAGLTLTLPEVVAFLEVEAPGIEQAGFGLRLPSWCRGKAQQRKLSLTARSRETNVAASGPLTLASIVRFDWEVALGDDQLTAEELSAIAQLKVPLVQVRGKWVHFSADELRAVSQMIQKKAGEEKPLADLVRFATVGLDVEGLPVEQVIGQGQLEYILNRHDGTRESPELACPSGLRADLRPYQHRGYSWLSFMADLGLGACLADDMGLGKTVQALALLQRRWENSNRAPSLLVCPTSVVGNWKKEAERFVPALPIHMHHGDDRSSESVELANTVRNQALVITSYNLLGRDAETLQSVPWSGVILDEAQNIKNRETRAAKAARGLSAKYRIALTGTPVENNVGDLWSIMEFLNPGFLGPWAEFERRFLLPIQRDRNAEAMARLRRAIRPFMLRRMKTDRSIIANLPDKQEMKVFCNLTREQATLYEAVLRDEGGKLAQCDDRKRGIKRRGMVLSLLGKLKQVCNHPAQFLHDRSPIPDRSGKLARLVEMLEEIRSLGERALVFTQYAEMGEILHRHLAEVFNEEVLFLHGGVPAGDQRNRLVERFQSAGGPAIFVLSLKAGGSGLNLTPATHVFHFDRWWNPAVENQATDRAYRIGQTRDVQVHKLLCIGTLEERIDQLIEGKKEITEQVVSNAEESLTELPTEELLHWLKLGEDAVAD